jgi:hypothetical protein
MGSAATAEDVFASTQPAAGEAAAAERERVALERDEDIVNVSAAIMRFERSQCTGQTMSHPGRRDLFPACSGTKPPAQALCPADCLCFFAACAVTCWQRARRW